MPPWASVFHSPRDRLYENRAVPAARAKYILCLLFPLISMRWQCSGLRLQNGLMNRFDSGHMLMTSPTVESSGTYSDYFEYVLSKIFVIRTPIALHDDDDFHRPRFTYRDNKLRTKAQKTILVSDHESTCSAFDNQTDQLAQSFLAVVHARA